MSMHLSIKLTVFLVMSLLPRSAFPQRLMGAPEQKAPLPPMTDLEAVLALAVGAMCLEESKVRPEVVQQMFETEKISDDEHAKCLLSCILQSTLMMTGNKINAGLLEFAFKSLTPDKSVSPSKAEILHAVSTCTEQAPDANACHTAYNLFKCMEDMGVGRRQQRGAYVFYQ